VLVSGRGNQMRVTPLR